MSRDSVVPEGHGGGGSVLSGPLPGVFMFLLVVLGTFLWVGYAITALTGGERGQQAGSDSMPVPQQYGR